MLAVVCADFLSFVKSQYKDAATALIKLNVINKIIGREKERSVSKRKSSAASTDIGIYSARSEYNGPFERNSPPIFVSDNFITAFLHLVAWGISRNNGRH